MDEEGPLPCLMYEASIALIAELDTTDHRTWCDLVLSWTKTQRAFLKISKWNLYLPIVYKKKPNFVKYLKRFILSQIWPQPQEVLRTWAKAVVVLLGFRHFRETRYQSVHVRCALDWSRMSGQLQAERPPGHRWIQRCFWLAIGWKN